MPTLEDISNALAAHRPVELDVTGHQQAAVAMVLREADAGPEVLFIERARREGDPWSGHMAFPGGRLDPGDAHARAAAERETLEEVGLPLDGAARLGRLSDKAGNPISAPRLVISAWVYRLDVSATLAPNHEVEQAFWFPVKDLLDPARQVSYPMRDLKLELPGILVGEPERHIVWGLTYSFLESFFDALGRPLPDRWQGLPRRDIG